MTAPVPAPAVKGLAFDPEHAVTHLAGRDRRLARVMTQAGPFTLRPIPTQSPFLALARSIVYQQLTGKAAATILGRVQALFPRRRIDPARLLDTDPALLRAAGLSTAKTLALQDLARRTLDGTVPSLARLRRLEDEEIIERLTAVRGVGRWTVEMFLMFRLGRPDVLPVGDLGVRKGFALTYRLDELPTPDAMRARAERWRPYRSVASWYMWRVLEL